MSVRQRFDRADNRRPDNDVEFVKLPRALRRAPISSGKELGAQTPARGAAARLDAIPAGFPARFRER